MSRHVQIIFIFTESGQQKYPYTIEHPRGGFLFCQSIVFSVLGLEIRKCFLEKIDISHTYFTHRILPHTQIISKLCTLKNLFRACPIATTE